MPLQLPDQEKRKIGNVASFLFLSSHPFPMLRDGGYLLRRKPSGAREENLEPAIVGTIGVGNMRRPRKSACQSRKGHLTFGAWLG